MAGLGDIFSAEAGQARTRWAAEQDRKIWDALDYYLGPTGIPDRLRGAVSLLDFTDAGDLKAMAEANRDFVADPSWGGAMNLVNTTGAAALPFVGAKMYADGVDVVGDAARSAGDDIRRFLNGEDGNTGRWGTTQFADPQDFPPEIMDELRQTPTGNYYRTGQPVMLADQPWAAWVTQDELATPPASSFTPDPNQMTMDLGYLDDVNLTPAQRAATAVPDDPDLAAIMSGGDGTLRYSPSRLAARKLKTKKGTYEQFRAELLKNGAKQDELTWSGFDQHFRGKKGLTREDIQQYLDGNTDLVEGRTASSSGRLGALDPDDDVTINELRQRYIEDNLDGEIEHYRENIIPDEIEMNSTYLRDMDEDELRELFDDYVGGDDAEFEYWKSQMVPEGLVYGDSSIYPSLSEAVDDYPDEFIAQSAREGLRENVYYNMTDDELIAWGGGTGDEAFDAGDTSFSNYFVKDVTDYQERTLHPTTKGRRYDGASAHFSDSPILHTRSAVSEGPDGRTLVAGEFQSDWAQRGRAEKKRFSTPEEEMAFAPRHMGRTPKGELEAVNEQAYIALRDAWYDDLIGVRPDRSMADDYTSITDTHAYLMNRPGETPPRFVGERALDNYQPMTSQPTIEPEAQYRWDFNTPAQTEAGQNLARSLGVDGWDDPGFTVRTDYVGGRPPDYRAPNRLVRGPDAPDSYPAARYLWENRPMPEGEGWLPGFGDGPVQAVARQFWDNPQIEDLPGLLERAASTEDFFRETIPSAPHVGGSTDKWSLAAWRDTLDDAIRRGDINRIALGSPEMASEMTMGTSGVGEYYNDILPKVVNKDVQKLYGKEFGLRPYGVNVTNRDGAPRTYPTYALDLTPEFIEQVKKKGIPLFAGFPAALGLADLMAYEQAEQL